MESISFPLFEKQLTRWSSAGVRRGDWFDSVVQLSIVSLKSGHYLAFSGFVVSCETLVYTDSLHWDQFTTEKERGKWNSHSTEGR